MNREENLIARLGADPMNCSHPNTPLDIKICNVARRTNGGASRCPKGKR